MPAFQAKVLGGTALAHNADFSRPTYGSATAWMLARIFQRIRNVWNFVHATQRGSKASMSSWDKVHSCEDGALGIECVHVLYCSLVKEVPVRNTRYHQSHTQNSAFCTFCFNVYHLWVGCSTDTVTFTALCRGPWSNRSVTHITISCGFSRVYSTCSWVLHIQYKAMWLATKKSALFLRCI